MPMNGPEHITVAGYGAATPIENPDYVTLRDQLAMAALTGLIGRTTMDEFRVIGPDIHGAVADTSYKYADAMLAAREAK